MDTGKLNESEQIHYQTLDKDYGRTKMVGSGYGEIDKKLYEELEALVQ